MRRACAAALLLAGCGGEEATPPNVESDRIECAVGGAAFERVCTAERDGAILTISHPDGGFRRFEMTGDGRGVIAADGAERAEVAIIGEGRIEVSLGGDRYRLPATVKGGS